MQKKLKGSKYILTSNRETLREKDKKASEDNKKNLELHYDEIINENKKLLLADVIKEYIKDAYQQENFHDMADDIDIIIKNCKNSENSHFKWFAKLLDSHYEGVIAHGDYQISSSKIEGINILIKTIRRQAYGLPNDEYFFLKVMDASRVKYQRNLKYHRVLP